MGWAVGEDLSRRRHIGYGVPATCDQPGCGEGIDRGLGYLCGDLGDGCGLFFCTPHGGGSLCDRCEADQPPHEPTPDLLVWVKHVLTHDSWARFRAECPDWTEHYRQQFHILQEQT